MIKELKDFLFRAHPGDFCKSEYIHTDCCDVPVECIIDFPRDGHWVWCPRCGDFKAFVRGEDVEVLAHGEQVWEAKGFLAASIDGKDITPYITDVRFGSNNTDDPQSED